MKDFIDWLFEHRAQLIPPVFGFIALYWMLPRERPVARSVGMAFGVVALGVLGFLFGTPDTSLYGLLFYVFAGTAIAAATATVVFPNPIYSALSFALVTLSVSGLFVLRGAQFLAATTVIIYAGAIIVTFLFIIMLSRHLGNATYDRRAREPFLSTLASFLLLSVLLFTLEDWTQARASQRPPVSPPASAKTAAPANPATQVAVADARTDLLSDAPPRSNSGFIPLPPRTQPYPHSFMKPNEPSPLRGFGRALFTDYLVTVEMAGTLLLVAGVGAVAIAPRRVRNKRSVSGRKQP